MIKQARAITNGHVPFSQLAAYGAGGIIPIALFNIAGILVGLMGNISLGLSAFWLGVILIIPRLWDAVSDPIIGHLSDNTRTRWGRRRPYLLIGGILVAIFFVLIWWIPKGDMVRIWFPSDAGFQAFQLTYILIFLLLFYTACTIFEIPHGALGMEITNDYHERTRLFSAKSFVGNLFAMSTPWLFALANMEVFKGTGNEADGMRYVSLMIAAILIPLSFWWTYKLKEPGFVKAAKHEKTPFWKDMKRTTRNRNFIFLTLTIFTLAMGFNFVNLLGSYIPIFYVFGGDKVAGAYLLGINGTVWAVTGVLAVFPLNWISPKVGKRKTLIIAITLMCLAQLSKIVCYNPSYPYLIIIPTVLLSAGMLFFFTLGASMVGDTCDEDELNTGYRAEGSYYSIYWWFIKMGTALASFVAGALIVFTMFDEVQVTKVDSLQSSIKELKSQISKWSDGEASAASTAELLDLAEGITSDALDESGKYVIFLEKEAEKIKPKADGQLTARDEAKKERVMKALDETRNNVNKLEMLQGKLEQAGPQTPDSLLQALVSEAIPLTLQTRLTKSEMNSFELKSHLQEEAAGDKKSKEHYQEIILNIAAVDNRINNLNTSASLDVLDTELSAIEKDITPLTQQSPYTLLMMRIVEIGLPLLLSILSFLFIYRYSLTEIRLHEIKDLLKMRNEGEDGESELADN